MKWQPASNGQIPSGAVPGGKTASGETLYIGRVRYEGSIVLGKIHPSHGAVYVPYGGLEVKFTDYEQLVYTLEMIPV